MSAFFWFAAGSLATLFAEAAAVCWLTSRRHAELDELGLGPHCDSPRSPF